MFNNHSEIIESEKISTRTKVSQHKRIIERIQSLKKINYKVFSHKSHKFLETESIFTILLTVHDANLKFIEKSIDSILYQTFKNTEFIIIDNGSTGEVAKYLEEVFIKSPSIKLMRVEKNQYIPSFRDRNPLVDLWNAGLFASIGNYIYFQSYDDLLSENYVELMVNLFEENPRCVSASPRVVSIDANGVINQEFTKILDSNNLRNRFESGLELSRSFIRGGKLFLAPGGLFAQRSSLVLDCGGFDSMNDLTQLFRFGVQGDVGFDARATLMWRHHEHQTNKSEARMGIIYYQEYTEVLARYDIQILHKKLGGNEFAREFVLYLKKLRVKQAFDTIRMVSFKYGAITGLRNLISLARQANIIVSSKALGIFFGVMASIFIRRIPLVKSLIQKLRKMYYRL